MVPSPTRQRVEIYILNTRFVPEVFTHIPLMYTKTHVVLAMRRNGCYSSEHFRGCMHNTMVGQDTRSKALLFINLLNRYSV